MVVAPILTQPLSLVLLIFVGALVLRHFTHRGAKIKANYLQSEEENNQTVDTKSLINYVSEMNELTQTSFFVYFLLFISAIVLAFYIYN